MRRKNVVVAYLLFLSFFIGGFFLACGDGKKKKVEKSVTAMDIIKGKALAAKYCQSCHLLPDPSWANRYAWQNGILPNMGPRLGIFEFEQKSYPYYKFDMSLRNGFYPSKPAMTEEEWKEIINYYTLTSPDSISVQQKRSYAVNDSLPLFTPLSPAIKYFTPATSYVKIDTASANLPVIISDATKSILYRLDKKLRFSDSIKTKGPVVDILFQGHQWLATSIGILNPNNGKYGSIQPFTIDPDNKMHNQGRVPLISELQRPVQLSAADLNQDGKQDFLVCEFGYLTGSLSWMENRGNDSFFRHVLRPLPGAIKAYVQDYNKDGLPDLWVLFAQGEEGLFLYTNQGNGQFSEKQVLRFPPIYGSSYFEMDDFNNDGFADILYTCGDNADHSTFLKPFHGIYIYLNDGHNQFTQQYFYPMNGCYKAIAKDYDNDGDLDIAAISFFPDYQHQPDEGFVYLQNKGNYDFVPYSLPATRSGRWLTMDAGDFDHDGKIDLILGNFSIAPSFIKSSIDCRYSPAFLLLKNTGKMK